MKKAAFLNFSGVKTAVAAILMAATLVLGTNITYAAKPQITAEAAILIDGQTGNILFEKNSQKRMYPASTTKIMTALVALDAVKNEEISLSQPLTLSQSAYDELDIDGSSIALKVGESMTLEGLLQGLLIASGNDAAAVIAEGISGSMEQFVARMNEKAKALGLENTVFVNPHGLHNENHYTTAYDMATLAREAMKNDTFRSIVECAHIYLPATNMSDKRYFINTNNLVSRMRYPYYFYDKATGIKTGSTDSAGYCLVSSAEDKGKSVIAVVFNASDISVSHNESKAILEHGLTDFSLKTLAKRDDIFGEVKVKQAADGTDHILLSADKNLDALFPLGGDTEKVEVVCEIPEKVYAPISSGQAIGKAKFIYEGKEIGSVDLCSTVEIKRHFLGFVLTFFEWLWSFRTIKFIVYTFLGLVLAFVMLIIIGFSRAIKKSKRKKRRTNRYNPPRY
ncbi:MAG: D-alanyl-D-alanine carboxypeptidase family protein [Clostridia bacterium]|nr:D-alanyl-D-alanine carboxypeptidase family protein [Clostridia bacterium]